MQVSEAKEWLERLVDEHGGLHPRQARNTLKDYEHKLIQETQRRGLALAAIRRSVDKLAEAVRRGVYDSRSIVGDEALNMLQEFEDLER